MHKLIMTMAMAVATAAAWRVDVMTRFSSRSAMPRSAEVAMLCCAECMGGGLSHLGFMNNNLNSPKYSNNIVYPSDE